MAKQTIWSTVSVRAAMQRINRKLAKNDQKLKTYRGGRSESDLGRYYIVDVNMNSIVATHCDVETLAKEVGALEAWERLDEEDS